MKILVERTYCLELDVDEMSTLRQLLLLFSKGSGANFQQWHIDNAEKMLEEVERATRRSA